MLLKVAYNSLNTNAKTCIMNYRYGFNGQEKINEVYGFGNLNIAEFWLYDTRLGRRWNRDPIDQISMSNYSVLGNNPIMNIDPQGDDPIGFFKWLFGRLHPNYAVSGAKPPFFTKGGVTLLKKVKVGDFEPTIPTIDKKPKNIKDEEEKPLRDIPLYRSDSKVQDRINDNRVELSTGNHKKGTFTIEFEPSDENSQGEVSIEIGIINKKGTENIINSIKTTDLQGELSMDFKLSEGEKLFQRTEGERRFKSRAVEIRDEK